MPNELNTLVVHDLWLRTTDETGSPTYSHHRVYDSAKFMAAREREAADLNEKKGSTKASAMQISQQQYRDRA